MKVKQYKNSKIKRAVRVRSTLHGTSTRPRLSVARSSQHLQAQLIDDTAGKTIIGMTTKTIKKAKDQTKTDLAKLLGEQLAKTAIDKKITQAIFDRGGNRYHGRVKAFAESARENGLKI